MYILPKHTHHMVLLRFQKPSVSVPLWSMLTLPISLDNDKNAHEETPLTVLDD